MVWKVLTEEQGRERLKTKSRQSDSGCWEWQGKVTRWGYGKMNWQKKEWQPHRLSYHLYRGAIPQGMLVCHRCDNRKCVNPDHLFLGTHQDNMNDGVSKNRFIHGESRSVANGRPGVLTDEIVRQILQLYRAGMKNRQIGERLGLGRYTVKNVTCGRAWKRIHQEFQQGFGS